MQQKADKNAANGAIKFSPWYISFNEQLNAYKWVQYPQLWIKHAYIKVRNYPSNTKLVYMDCIDDSNSVYISMIVPNGRRE